MSFTELEIPDQLRWRREQRNADGLDPGWLYDRQTDDDHVSGNESEEDWQASGAMNLKLSHAVLAVCLNLGTPQGLRTKTEEAFFDPFTRHHERSMRKIMSNLIDNVDHLQKISIMALPDPKSDTLINAVTKARRESNDQQMLFLYNDHGTLAPTEQGEIWVYDTDFPTTPTTYNPVFVSHIMEAASPGMIYLWDCDNAGKVIDTAVEHAKRRDHETELGIGHIIVERRRRRTHLLHDVHFGASAHKQILPTAEGLPRDVFTSCMLSPLHMALRHHYLANDMRMTKTMVSACPRVNPEMLLRIPGQLNDRNSPLGDMNWLLLAVLETIAFQSYPLAEFRKLFRSNSGLAGLARGFILAQRVLRQYDCTPTSYPVLPSTHLHPLWQVWDTTVDDFLCQFPLAEALPGHPHVYRQPKLLAEQLLAFSAQLTLFAESCESDDGRKKAAKLCADTLPMIFFAAAGGSYRLLALTLLVRYLDIGGRAPVEWSFACGIDQLRSRMLSWKHDDEAVQVAFIFQRLCMLPEQGHPLLLQYNPSTGTTTIAAFTALLQRELEPTDGGSGLPPDITAGILYMMSLVPNLPGFSQNMPKEGAWLKLILQGMQHKDDLVQQWSLLLLASIWNFTGNAEMNLLERILDLLVERAANISEQARVSAVYALWQCFRSEAYVRAATAFRRMILRATARVLATASLDASIMVRQTLLVCLEEIYRKRPSWLTLSPWCYAATKVKSDAESELQRECELLLQGCLHCCDGCTQPEITVERLAALEALCNAMTRLARDPDHGIRSLASSILQKASTLACESPLGKILPLLSKSIDSLGNIIDLYMYNLERGEYMSSSSGTIRAHDTNQIVALPGPQYPQLLIALRDIVHEQADPTKLDIVITIDLAKKALDWRKKSERYFHLPRLIWATTKPIRLTSPASQKARRARHATMESESRADRPWSHVQAVIKGKAVVQALQFHSCERLLAISEAHCTVFHKVDDGEEPFQAVSKLADRWGSLKRTLFLNEQHDLDTILQISTEGVVRLQRNATAAEQEKQTSLLFQVPRQAGYNVVDTWCDSRRQLAISNRQDTIGLWDLREAKRVRKLNINRQANLTCLDYEKEQGFLLAGGYHDGALDLFDLRQNSQSPVVSWKPERPADTLSCHITMSQEIVSTDVDGSIDMWDLRVPTEPISSTRDHGYRQSGITIAATAMDSVSLFAQLSVHPPGIQPELFVSRLAFPYPVQTSILSLPGHIRQGDTACLAFHPNELKFAIAIDGDIAIRCTS